MFSILLLLEQIFGVRLAALFIHPLKRKFLYAQQLRTAGKKLKKVNLVERREGLTPEQFFKEYYTQSKAVIFSRAAQGWPCCEKWDMNFFSQAHGEHPLLTVEAPGLTTRSHDKGFQFLSIQSLIENIKGGGEKYLRFSPLLHERPELALDLNLDWLEKMRGGGTFGNTYYMFIGGKKQKTYLHADQPCNLYVQVYGEKKWTLYYPKDSIALYPEVTNTAYVKSPIDIDNPDLEKYPLFAQAEPWEAHLKPGDVMYIPPHVWHQVENLTDTIAVGYRFSSLKASFKSSVLFTLIRILSTNPPIWKTMKYGKIDTNLIWAHANGNINEVLVEKNRLLQRKKPPELHN